MADGFTKTAEMSLASVITGKVAEALRVLLYGGAGIGKTTWASKTKSPIFLDLERSTSEMDVARFPEPENYDGCVAAVRALITEEHDYKTLVIDALDRLELFIQMKVCRDNGWANIEEPGWGRGYVACRRVWEEFLGLLDQLQAERSVNVVLIAHEWIETFNNPDGNNYSHHGIKLDKRVRSLVIEWASSVLFAQFKTVVSGDEKKAKAKRRVLHTTEGPTFVAKNRVGLPEEMSLDFEEFKKAYTKGLS